MTYLLPPQSRLHMAGQVELNEDAEDDALSSVATAPVSDERRPAISRKVIAVITVAAAVCWSAGAVWYVFFCHWSIEDVAEQVIFDPDVGSPGYKHGLAG
ncbi:MAG: hypothetical protein ACUVT7_08570 [Thermoplasmata archaeon]